MYVEAWIEQAEQGTLAPRSRLVDVGVEEWWNQLVGFVLHDGRIPWDARSLLTRVAEMVELPDYDLAIAARKQMYRKRVAHGLADRGGRGI